jgi:hypothetical protein
MRKTVTILARCGMHVGMRFAGRGNEKDRGMGMSFAGRGK